MNRHNAAEFIPLLQALADGKIIQLTKATVDGKRVWVDLSPNNLTFGLYDPSSYRVKPEPQVIWACMAKEDGEITGTYTDKHTADTQALRFDRIVKKFVESD